jgi:hypothetical protein
MAEDFGVTVATLHQIFEPTPALFDAYFAGPTTCSACKAVLDLWQSALLTLSLPTPMFAFGLLGARTAVFTVNLHPERAIELDLSSFPPEAELLRVYVHLFGTLGDHVRTPLPALMLGSELRLDPFPRRLNLYGTTNGQPDVVAGQVRVFVEWLDPEKEELSVHHLADAGKQFVAGRYKSMIIPANIAVEAALTPALHAWVRLYCPSEDADGFFGPRGATYSQQLKVLSRIASLSLGIKRMPGRVRNLLDELRQYRNDLVHTGALEHKERPAPDKAKAADFLAAAVFGYHYARYLRANLPKKTTLPKGARLPRRRPEAEGPGP